MEKEIKITPPEGFEIDNENSTFECIRFKPAQNKKRWRDDIDRFVSGYYIDSDSKIRKIVNRWNLSNAHDTFATQKQAKSALAMARISQIMANDERFGGVITDEEWQDTVVAKFVIVRDYNGIELHRFGYYYAFLAFHTAEQRELFFKENEDLVRDYLML